MKILFSFFILIASLFAQDYPVAVKEVISGSLIEFHLDFQKGDLIGELRKDKRVLKTYIKSAATEPLKQMKFYRGKKNNYALISFVKGVHGRAFELWDINKGVSVLRFNSVWPIEILSHDNHIEVIYYDYAHELYDKSEKRRKFTL